MIMGARRHGNVIGEFRLGICGCWRAVAPRPRARVESERCTKHRAGRKRGDTSGDSLSRRRDLKPYAYPNQRSYHHGPV